MVWRWMFRLEKGQGGQQLVRGQFFDTNGTLLNCLGGFDAEGKTLTLSQALGPDAKIVFTVKYDSKGDRVILSNIHSGGKVIPQYKGLDSKS